MIALGAFLIPYAISYLGTALLLRSRLQKRFVDVPNERSSHESPKPRFGGIAIVAAFYVTFGFLAVTFPATRGYAPVLAGGLLLFAAGLIDDRRGMSVWARVGVQLAAALTLVAFGVVVDHIYIPVVGVVEFGWVSVPLTVLFVLASINFYNFIDGIDGLAAGGAFIGSIFLSIIAMFLGHNALAIVFLAMAGSSAGFLQFNFPPSRLFMGDSGSTFLGYFFAYVAIAGNQLVPQLPLFIPLLILSSLYLDAGLTLLNRLIRGENIFRAHHMHYYQRLLSLGLNHKQVTLLEYAILVLLGVSGIVYFKAGGWFPVFVSGCWIVLFAAMILKIRSLERGDKLFWERRTVFVITTDLALIVLAFVGAYFLRMNFRFTEAEGNAMLRALPIVLIVRSACFLKFGLYKSVWKYTSTSDIVRIIKAVTAGSAINLVAVVLLYRFVAFPRTLFIIEYFLLTLLILGSRFSFRLFHEIGKEALGANARRVAIVGAGDNGDRVGRELRNARGGEVAIACYIDDDPAKIGLTLHGVPIVGPIDRLADIVGEQRVDAVVVAVRRLPDGRLRDIITGARAAGVPVEGRRDMFPWNDESAALGFERLRYNLRRSPVFPLAPDRASFFGGTRVLLTHGGDRIGPAMARELALLGADVHVQCDSPAEASRFSARVRERINLHLCALTSRDAVDRLLADVAPDVVFDTVPLDAATDFDAADFVWERAVRGTSYLCDAMNRSTVGTVVSLGFWGDSDAETNAARIGAIGEAILLNSPSLSRAAPKAIRYPSILTESRLREITDGGGVERTYALLETEAVGLALNVAASSAARTVTVPVWEREVTARDVAVGSAVAADGLPLAVSFGPTFPAEKPAASELAGARVLQTPLYPEQGGLERAWANSFADARAGDREEWIRLLTGPLYHLAPIPERSEV